MGEESRVRARRLVPAPPTFPHRQDVYRVVSVWMYTATKTTKALHRDSEIGCCRPHCVELYWREIDLETSHRASSITSYRQTTQLRMLNKSKPIIDTVNWEVGAELGKAARFPNVTQLIFHCLTARRTARYLLFNPRIYSRNGNRITINI